MKEHIIGQIHNDLRTVGIKYAHSGQLRSRLATVIAPLVDENKELLETEDRLVARIIEQKDKIKELEEKIDDLNNMMCEEYD